MLVPEIGNFMRRFMQAATDTMPGKISDNPVAAFICFCFYQMANITYINTAFDAFNCLFQNSFGSIYQALLTIYIISQYKRASIVGPETIQLGRHIDIDQITFL